MLLDQRWQQLGVEIDDVQAREVNPSLGKLRGRYADCGVSHMIFDVMAPDVAALQHAMDRFVRDVRTGLTA